jgi:hypothetical protein
LGVCGKFLAIIMNARPAEQSGAAAGRGRPAQRGREVFGGLVPYGEIWRTGADLATHLSTDRPLRLGRERLPAGSYSMFTIPEPDGWTLVLSGAADDAPYDSLEVPAVVPGWGGPPRCCWDW